MREDIKKYLKLKEQIKALNAEVIKLGAAIRKESELKEGEKLTIDGFSMSYMPTRRFVMKANRGKGLAGFIKRHYGEDLCTKLMRFDYKDLVPLGKDVSQFFEEKVSYALRIKEEDA